MLRGGGEDEVMGRWGGSEGNKIHPNQNRTDQPVPRLFNLFKNRGAKMRIRCFTGDPSLDCSFATS